MVFPNLFDLIIHLDKYLNALTLQYGSLVYLILFMIIFMETGFVITPFLPGDSLLFAAGAACALGALKIGVIWPLLIFAAILGDNLNYWIGYFVGPKVFSSKDSRFFNRKYLDRAHRFYEHHGVKTVIIARYIPIVRSFAPFVAGIAKMNYLTYFLFDTIGAFLWVSLFVLGGFFFGNIPAVKDNFTFVILAIIFISLLPAALELLKHMRESKKKSKEEI